MRTVDIVALLSAFSALGAALVALIVRLRHDPNELEAFLRAKRDAPKRIAPKPVATKAPGIVCPSCKGSSVTATLHTEFPPDGSSDEVTLSLLACEACEFVGACLYEESRRGSLDHESYRTSAWPISRPDFEKLSALLGTCSKRRDPRCTCEAHTVLGKTNPSNDWDGLRQNGYALGGWFRIS